MKQGRTLSKIPILNNKANTLKVELYYSKGGMNYFSGRNEIRGLYLSASPVELTYDNGRLVSESFTAFSGVKQLVKETKRFNQKELDTFMVEDVLIKTLVDHVIEKNKLEVAKENLVVS